VLADPKMNPRDTMSDAAKTLPESQNHGDWRESKVAASFFRSLLVRTALSKVCGIQQNQTLIY
jgi:hypothetical protein